MPIITLLLTRPHKDSVPLARTLKEAGFDTVIAPLLAIEPLPDAWAEVQEHPDLLIATSRHGILKEARDIPLIVTGEESAAHARMLGYKDITIVQRARDVVPHIAANYPKTARILYMSGRDVTLDVAQELRGLDYAAQRIIAYTAHAAESMPDEVVTQLKQGAVNGILFFSARSVEIYAYLAARHGISEHTPAAFCLSAEIAQAASGHGFKTVFHPQKTNTQALVDEVISRFRK